jgi:ABC-type branched-subunit amino acid transport system substrate-binding protein
MGDRMKHIDSWLVVVGLATLAFALPSTSDAQKKYDSGATDTEIKIGNTMPYSGPASAWGTQGKTAAAFFKMLNEQGGINGRKINFISLDDGYSPPKTVEATRRLVEQDRVFLLFFQVGTPTNSAIHKYVNGKGIPHLFVSSGSSKWVDPQNFPWTMPALLPYQTEGALYAQAIKASMPEAKIALLYQNDDLGKDYVKGFKSALGPKAGMIVSEQTYEVSDPLIDSQVVALQSSGANVLFSVANSKAAAQAIRKTHNIGWEPTHYLASVGASVSSTLVPAGVENSVGIISAAYNKDARDPQWANDPAMKTYIAFMRKYYPEGDALDGFNVNAYNVSYLMMHVLRQCADDLTHDNVLRQAVNLKNVELPLLLPGIRINTSPTDYRPIEGMILRRFDGTRYVPIGELIGN